MRIYLRHSSAIPVALVALQFAIPAFAQQTALELDPARTEIHFALKSSLHTVHGTFKLKSGKVSFDPQTGKLSGLIVADATTGESGNGGRDSKMHREIIESKKYPEITFAPHDLEGSIPAEGDSRVQVKGAFALLGQDHELVVPVDVRFSGSEATLDANFSIPYIAWGLKNPSTFILRAADTVQVSIHGVGTLMRDPRNQQSSPAARLDTKLPTRAAGLAR
jgi:polyisoprenoid-binding protein YceI